MPEKSVETERKQSFDLLGGVVCASLAYIWHVFASSGRTVCHNCFVVFSSRHGSMCLARLPVDHCTSRVEHVIRLCLTPQHIHRFDLWPYRRPRQSYSVPSHP